MAIALLLGLASFAQSWLAIDGSDRISGDPGRDMQIALNMIRHGEFHDTPALAGKRQQGTLRAYANTEPVFPTFLALIFWNAPEMIESIGVPCFRRNQQCREGDAARTRVLRVGAVSRGMTVSAATAATFALTGSLFFTTLGGFASLLLLAINWSTMSVLAGLFLLTHSVLAALVWCQPRIATGALSGVALGLLVLTRAVFQYWLAGVAIVWLLGAWLYPDRRRATAPAFAALVIAAWTTTFPWLVRNASYAGVLGVSGGDAQVLAIRAEYGRISWSELQGAFAYYVPSFLGSARDWAMNVLEPPVYGYARLVRNNPNGFYRQANTWTGETARRANRIEPGWRDRDPIFRDHTLRQAGLDLYREQWLKQVALSAVFASRGSGGLLLPALVAVWILMRYRPDFMLAFLFLPAASAAVLLSVATHFIPRYGFPFMPLAAVAFALTLHTIVSRLTLDEAGLSP